MKSKLITFDGHDGVGKSTLIKEVCKRLYEQNFSYKSIESINKRIALFREQAEQNAPNVWYYFFAWLDLEKRLISLFRIYDIILVDRSFFSTIVSFKARGLNFPDEILNSFINPSLSLWIRVNEDERRKRLMSKKMLPHDYNTLNYNLITRADEIYASLGLTEIINEGNIQEIASYIVSLIIKLDQ